MLGADQSLNQHPAPGPAMEDDVRSGQVRTNKRPRTKGIAACNECRNRRSKCDLIDVMGCHRCKQLGSPCSFRKSDAASEELQRQVAPATSSPSPQITRDETIAALAEKVAKLEKTLHDMQTTGSSSHAHAPQVSPSRHAYDYSISTGPSFSGFAQPVSAYGASPSRHSPQDSTPVKTRIKEPDRDETWFRTWADPERFSLINRGMQSKEEIGLKDPIEEGIISESQAEMMYLLFKSQFAAVYPHPTLLVVHSALPSHPFLLSACLYYVIRCNMYAAVFTPEQIQHIEGSLYANLNAYHRGCRPSLEGIFASFILSFLPTSTLETNGSELDPIRMVGLAYTQIREIGQSVYLDRLVKYLEQGIPSQHLEKQLNDARMFMSVINRSAWFAHSRCPWASLPVLVEDSQKQILALLDSRNILCDLDRHLMLEHQFLNVLHEHSRAWQVLQRYISPCVNDIKEGNLLVVSAQTQLDTLRAQMQSMSHLQSIGYLRCHVTYCKWWVAVRNIWSVYRLPSPMLIDAAYDAWLAGMILAASSGIDMVNRCLDEKWRLGRLPAAIGNAIVLCYAALSTGIIHFERHLPSQPLPPCLSVRVSLETIEAHIRGETVGLARSIDEINEKLLEYRLHLTTTRDASLADTDVMPQWPALGDLATSAPFELPGIGNTSADAATVNDVIAGLENWWDWTFTDFGGLMHEQSLT